MTIKPSPFPFIHNVVTGSGQPTGHLINSGLGYTVWAQESDGDRYLGDVTTREQGLALIRESVAA